LKKWVLSRHDSVEMIGKIESSLQVSLNLPKSAQASCEEPGEGVVFVHLDHLTFVRSGDAFIPFLGSPATLALFPSAVVDEGAIKFMLNGADVMRPGVKKYDSWGAAGKTVIVKEEKKMRAIAVGQSVITSEEAAQMSKGVCIKNLHHVGDKFWNLYKTI
jgi:PUA domain protein